MTEAELGELLERDLAAYNLVVQVTQQNEFLVITLNRPADSELDYTALTETITARIQTLQLPGIHTLMLYSRILGEYDVDWQTQLEFISPPLPQQQQEPASSVASTSQPQSASGNISATTQSPEPNSQMAATVASVEANAVVQEFKLSDYCFTRNQGLLRGEILPPAAKIAQLVQFFDTLPDQSKKSILPILEQFLSSLSPPIEQFDLEVKQWFEQLAQLNNLEIRKAAIWFSRYCFNPEKTMAEVIAVLEPETVKVETEPEISQELALAVSPKQEPTTVYKTKITQKQTHTRTSIPQTKTTTPENWQRLALPIGWLIFTGIVIIFAIHSVNPAQLIAQACQNATSSQKYCKLAAQIAGELSFKEAAENTVPLTPENKSQSLKICEDYSNLRAVKTFSQIAAPSVPVLSSSGEEVLPGIFIVDVKQTNLQAAGATVRTACVFRNTAKRMALLGLDVIPNNWPNEPYKSRPIPLESLRKALGVYNIVLSLGMSTLFTVIGIFIAAMFGLGVRVYSLDTIYKAAFFLGIIETIISIIPLLGFFARIPLETLALGVVSGVVKDFHIEWADGYRVVAAGAITIIVVRYILTLALFGLIAVFVN